MSDYEGSPPKEQKLTKIETFGLIILTPFLWIADKLGMFDNVK